MVVVADVVVEWADEAPNLEALLINPDPNSEAPYSHKLQTRSLSLDLSHGLSHMSAGTQNTATSLCARAQRRNTHLKLGTLKNPRPLLGRLPVRPFGPGAGNPPGAAVEMPGCLSGFRVGFRVRRELGKAAEAARWVSGSGILGFAASDTMVWGFGGLGLGEKLWGSRPRHHKTIELQRVSG